MPSYIVVVVIIIFNRILVPEILLSLTQDVVKKGNLIAIRSAAMWDATMWM